MRMPRIILEDLEEAIEVMTMSDSFAEQHEPEHVDMMERLYDRLAILREESGKTTWIDAGEFDEDELRAIRRESKGRLRTHKNNLEYVFGKPSPRACPDSQEEYESMAQLVKAYKTFLDELR